MSNISKLRIFVNNSIIQPNFLIDLGTPLSVKNLTWNGVENILINYSEGICSTILSQKNIRVICKEIDSIIGEIGSILSERDIITISIWIVELIDKWIEMAIELEEFESAKNLTSLLNNEY